MLKFKNILPILLLTALFSCNPATKKFTTEKWLSGDGLTFNMRDEILDDLVKTHPLKGQTYKQIQHLLGYPDHHDSVSFQYMITDTYTNMYKHKHIKNLVFYMGKDSVISRYEVYDKEFKK